MDIRFYVNNALTHENVGRLYPTEYTFGEPLVDAGQGSLQVSFEANRPGSNSLLRRILPNRAELIMCVGPLSDNKILWAGWIDTRLPNGKSKTVTFTATHWRAWLYKKYIPPRTFGTENTLIGDKYGIVYDLVDFACTSSAAPDITHGSTLAGGVNRKVVISNWWSVGYAIDDLAKRANGLEWTVDAVWDGATQRTKLVLRMWYPGSSRLNNNVLLIENLDNHTNSVGDLKEDGTGQATRVFASTGGEEPVYTSDQDVNLGDNGLLLLESVSHYGNLDKKELFALANSERVERNNPYSTIPITMSIDRPPVTSYRVGDRIRLRLKDSWNNLDIVGARIVARTIAKQNGSPATSTISVDLTDVTF